MRRWLCLPLLSTLLVAGDALGCPVCYGEHNDAAIFRGAEVAMFFLLGMTYSVIGGGALGIWLLRRRQRPGAGE